jgi:Bifunctional DNA primase/polymerase, N-terminal
MDLHPNIKSLALLGWRLHPTSRRTRAACFTDAATLATSDLEQLARWSCQYTGCGWRVVMEGSAIWALDVDVPSASHKYDGVAALRQLIAIHGLLPLRPTTRSGGGRLGLFFRHDGEPIVGDGGHPALGIDPRRGRQSVTVPPSLHPGTGRPYRWLVAPWELAPPPAPAWLLKLLAPPPLPSIHVPPLRLAGAGEARRRYALAALRHAAHRAATAPLGTRNDTLNTETFRLTRFLAEGTLGAMEVATAMAYAGRQAGLLPPEVKATLASALAAGSRR